MGKIKNKEKDWERWLGIVLLNRVVGNSFVEKVTVVSDLKELRKLAI